MQHRFRPLLAALVLATGASSCVEDLDTDRVVPERQSLGAEIYEVMCQRVAYSEIPEDVSGRSTRALCRGEADVEDWTPPRLRALTENRARLVRALDQVLPPELEDDLRDFLLDLLPLYEAPRDRLPAQVRATAELLGKMMADDQALAALARLSTRRGYRPPRIALGVARPLLAYSDFDDFAGTALRTIDEGGPAASEWDALLRALALEMATAPSGAPRPPSEDTTLRLARRLMYSENDAFASTTPRMVVVRDPRGLVLPEATAGALPSPFVDTDADGLADVDAFGRFVDSGGRLLSLPTPFAVPGEVGVPRDSRGRALRSDGTYFFAYRDTDRTMLAGLARETRGLLDPRTPAAMDLAYGMPALMGRRTTRTEILGTARLDFMGYDTASGPLFDVIYALGQALRHPETADALLAAERLTANEEASLAGIIDAALDADHRADLHPEAVLERPSLFWDDMLDVGRKVARTPGLTEGLLRALADPRSRRLGAVYGAFMRYRDDISYDPRDINAPVVGDFVTEVDRTRPDVIGNQSLFERSVALIHDLDGVRVCNKEGAYLSLGGVHVWPVGSSYHECEMFEIPNAAEFYALATVGRARLEFKPAGLRGLLELGSMVGLDTDALLEDLTGIDGMDTSPTARAVARFSFAPHNEFLRNVVDPIRTRDGVDAVERHGTTIFAWEKEIAIGGERVSFLSVMAPVLEAFTTYDAEGGEFLFGTMTTALHRHWASRDSDFTQRTSPAAPNFSYQDNLRSYEELIAEVFDEGQLIERLNVAGAAMDRTEIRPGVDATDALAAAGEILLDPNRNPGLTFRDGRLHPCRNDGVCLDGSGGTVSLGPAPMDLVLDALAKMDTAFAAAPDRHEKWLAARSALVDQLMSTSLSGGSYALANRRAHATMLVMLPFLRERVEAHRTAGDLDAWASTLHQRAERSMGSALGVAMIDFLDAVQRDPEARDAVIRLGHYLMEEATSSEALDHVVVAMADLVQVLEDERTTGPLMHALADGIAPNARDVAARGGALELDGSALDATVRLLRDVRDVDDARVMRRILSNLVARPPGTDETPLETIADVIAEVNRATPGAGGTLDVTDWGAVLGNTHDFFGDRDRGMERFFDVVSARRLSP